MLCRESLGFRTGQAHERRGQPRYYAIGQGARTQADMAPQRFANAGAADERSGIYAVGAVAYLLLSGKRIFHEANGDDLQMRIVHSVPAPRAAMQAVPAALTDLIMQCLAKRPEERPANGTE